MSREIKFRVWDNVDSMFVFNLDDLISHKMEFTSDCPVMQFTGLYDHKGKDIYEGDILGCYGNITLDVIEPYFEVIWDKDSYNIGGESETDYVIIGNIYSNPELLKHN